MLRPPIKAIINENKNIYYCNWDRGLSQKSANVYIILVYTKHLFTDLIRFLTLIIKCKYGAMNLSENYLSTNNIHNY